MCLPFERQGCALNATIKSASREEEKEDIDRQRKQIMGMTRIVKTLHLDHMRLYHASKDFSLCKEDTPKLCIDQYHFTVDHTLLRYKLLMSSSTAHCWVKLIITCSIHHLNVPCTYDGCCPGYSEC